jgi:hypothetical protein
MKKDSKNTLHEAPDDWDQDQPKTSGKTAGFLKFLPKPVIKDVDDDTDTGEYDPVPVRKPYATHEALVMEDGEPIPVKYAIIEEFDEKTFRKVFDERCVELRGLREKARNIHRIKSRREQLSLREQIRVLERKIHRMQQFTPAPYFTATDIALQIESDNAKPFRRAKELEFLRKRVAARSVLNKKP